MHKNIVNMNWNTVYFVSLCIYQAAWKYIWFVSETKLWSQFHIAFMSDSVCTIYLIVTIVLCMLQNLAEDKGKPKIVPSIASMDTVSSLKSPPPMNNHSGHNKFENKPENHTVSTKGKIVLKCFIYILFAKIIYFICRLEMGIEIERHYVHISRALFFKKKKQFLMPKAIIS